MAKDISNCIRVFGGLGHVLAKCGVSKSAVLATAGLPADLLEPGEKYITIAEYYRLCDAAVEVSGRLELPLELALARSLLLPHPVVYAGWCSRDLKSALERISWYKTNLGICVMKFQERRNEIVLQLESKAPEMPLPVSMSLYEMTYLVEMARREAGFPICPTSISFPDMRAVPAAVSEYFRVTALSGDTTAITFSMADATRPFMTYEPLVWPSLREAFAMRSNEQTNYHARVCDLLADLLPSGQATIEAVAERMAMSKRTLQRRLAGEGCNFQALLNETRKKLAGQHLENRKLTSADISFLLGYKDPNSFIRAYHEWTGRSPRSTKTGGHLN